jgi:DNA-binding response OmpR family regulator
MSKILVVDDEPDVCEILKFNLESVGHEVDMANSAEEAMGMLSRGYNLFLLDVMMDGMSGFSFASHLRQQAETALTPIIFVTAKDTENDTLTGFSLGADDYIRKPFSVVEVLARVEAVLRRFRGASSAVSNMLQYETLTLNLDTKRATVGGQDVSLTKKEFEILHLLLATPGKVYSRDELLSIIWPDDANILERSVDVNIARMRKKIGHYARHIISRSGYGYCFTESVPE